MRSSALFLSIVIFVSAIAIALHSYVRSSAKGIQKRIEKEEKINQSEEIILQALALLNDDEQLKAKEDSPFSKIFEDIKKLNTEDVKVELLDESSRFNLNFMRFEMLTHNLSTIKLKMKPGYDAGALEEHRSEVGFVTDIEEYKSFFKDDKLDEMKEYFTFYNFANINNSHQNRLADLYTLRIGNEGDAQRLDNIVAEVRRQFKIIKEEDFKKMMLSFDPEIKTVLSEKPYINVNFADPDVIETIISYPYRGKVTFNIPWLTQSIIERRQERAFTEASLRALINPKPEQERVMTYLGVKTWFWKIRVTSEEETLEAIAALVTRDQESGYKLVSLKRVDS